MVKLRGLVFALRAYFPKLPGASLTLKSLPADSDYVRDEIQEMAEQLHTERQLVGEATAKTLLKEMFVIPGNRKRAVISVILMICQQMTGVNAIVRLQAPNSCLLIPADRDNF